MKTLLRQILILALIALASSHAHRAVALISNAARTAHCPANLHASKSVSQASERGQAKPAPAPSRWRGLIGEYGPDDGILYILEKDGRLYASFKRAEPEALEEVSKNIYRFPAQSSHAGQRLVFTRNARGRATQVEAGSVPYKRRQIEPEEGANQLRVTPQRRVPELLKEARAAEPPKESGEFRQPDLGELTKLDPTIKLEIRYATNNNLFGTVFYSEAHAFMQRPAAESVVRANRKLKAQASTVCCCAAGAPSSAPAGVTSPGPPSTKRPS